jgi:hypothetical protein
MSRARFRACSCGPLELDDFWEAQGLLAKWFGFQPSEIAELELQDFESWVRMAIKQIEARAKATQA